MRNINSVLLDKRRTSIFIAHRLRTVVDAGSSDACERRPLLTASCRYNLCPRQGPGGRGRDPR
jgi:hypothetical protein